jgi:hypothetical protein
MKMVGLSAFVLLYAFLASIGKAHATSTLRSPNDSARKLPSNDDPPEDTIVSYFIVEYAANYESLENINIAAQALAVAYNKLITLYDDPFNRRMDVEDGVDVLDASVLDERSRRLVGVSTAFGSSAGRTSRNQLPENQERQLQSGARILAVLRQRGTSSRGCPGNCGYSNDSSRRALGVGSTHDDEYHDYPGYPNDGDDYSDHDGYDDDNFSDDDYYYPPLKPSPPNHPPLRPGLPSEEEIRRAYSAEIRSLGLSNIVGVTALEEVDEPPGSNGSKGGGKVAKDSTSTKHSKKSKAKKSDKSSKSYRRGQ